MPIDHPSTTLLFIDNHDDDRQYWAQRLRMSSPDYVIFEASTGKSGLAICRSIIEAHDGRLWASSGVHRGAVFNVLLPTPQNTVKDDWHGGGSLPHSAPAP